MSGQMKIEKAMMSIAALGEGLSSPSTHMVPCLGEYVQMEERYRTMRRQRQRELISVVEGIVTSESTMSFPGTYRIRRRQRQARLVRIVEGPEMTAEMLRELSMVGEESSLQRLKTESDRSHYDEECVTLDLFREDEKSPTYEVMGFEEDGVDYEAKKYEYGEPHPRWFDSLVWFQWQVAPGMPTPG